MSLKELSPNEVFSREQAVNYLTNKYELKRRAVFEQINNLRAKLNPNPEDENKIIDSWPKKTERRIKALERLEKSAAYVHSVERRVEEVLMRKHI